MFDRALFERWLAALRSGKYQQCQYFLHKEDGFCCLGVACDLIGTKWVHASFDDTYGANSTSATKVPLNEELETFGLNEKIKETVSVESSLTVKENNIGMHLAGLNDSGFSFRFIAAVAGYMVEQTQRELGNV